MPQEMNGGRMITALAGGVIDLYLQSGSQPQVR